MLKPRDKLGILDSDERRSSAVQTGSIEIAMVCPPAGDYSKARDVQKAI